MPRRLAPLAVLLVVAIVSAGCAEDRSSAATVNGSVITNEELLDQVGEWAGSPTLLGLLQLPPGGGEGAGAGTYSMTLVGSVLNSMINFELTDAEFEARDLELGDDDVAAARENLVGEQTEQLYREISDPFADDLVQAVARQSALQEELGEEFSAWLTEAYQSAAIEVSSRYGSWDDQTLGVVPPEGPTVPAGDSPLGP